MPYQLKNGKWKAPGEEDIWESAIEEGKNLEYQEKGNSMGGRNERRRSINLAGEDRQGEDLSIQDIFQGIFSRNAGQSNDTGNYTGILDEPEERAERVRIQKRPEKSIGGLELGN